MSHDKKSFDCGPCKVELIPFRDSAHDLFFSYMNFYNSAAIGARKAFRTCNCGFGIGFSRMFSPQQESLCFDKQVSQSPDDSHQAYTEPKISISYPCSQNSCQQKSEHGKSIDELLVKYRPTQNSILQCIECLDESSFTSTHSSRDPSMMRESALITGEKTRAPEDSRSTAAPLLQCRSHQPQGLLNGKITDESSDRDEVDAIRSRKRRRYVSVKEKEERRREQNRDAQRRYRERNMLSSARDSSERPMILQNAKIYPYV